MNKGLEAIKAIRAMLPKATVRTRTMAPDGKVIYEDEEEVQQTQAFPSTRGCCTPRPWHPSLRPGARPRTSSGSIWSSRDDRPARSSLTWNESKDS